MKDLTNSMSAEHTSPEWPNWLNAGWAFLLAIVGWVWHAGRLASKVDNFDKKLDKHVDDESDIWKDNKATHDDLVKAITEIKEDLAYIKGKSRRHPHSHSEE